MRDRKDPGTLGYIIVHRRPDGGLPLLSKALPSVTEMDDFRKKWPESDVALYLTEEGALSAWETLDEEVRARTDVKAVVTYYEATVKTDDETLTLEQRRRALKEEVSKLVYRRNKLLAGLEQAQRQLREVKDQLPHAESDANAEAVSAVLRGKQTDLTGLTTKLQAELDEVGPLCEQAKNALIALQVMLKEDADQSELHTARASLQAVQRHIKAVLDLQS